MDVSQVPELVKKEAYPVLMDAYAAQPLVYPQICEVLPVGDDYLYGDKGQVITGMGRFKDRLDGQEVERDEFRSARTWYLQTKQKSVGLDIPERMLRATNAAQQITQLVQQAARDYAENAARQKDDFVADMLQKGTLTAGSAEFFDGSYPNQTDPNPKFIYDGLPFFDTAHTQAVGSSTYSNHLTGTALTEANLDTAWVRMTSTNAKNERGERVTIRPNTLIVPPGLARTAMTLMESEGTTGSAVNDVNIFKGRFRVISWDALDDAASSAAWWMCEAGKGIRVRDSGVPSLDLVWDGTRKQWTMVMEYHFGAAVTNWRYWLNANKAAA